MSTLEIGDPHEIAHRTIERDGWWLTISRLGREAGLDDLRGRRGYLMVSVKNPSFSARLVRMFCDLAETHLETGEVVLFDTPYAATIAATEPDEAERSRKLSALRRVARERRALVEKTTAQRSTRVPIRSFEEVARAVPPALTREVRYAFETGGRFRRAVLDRARGVLPDTIPAALLPRYAEFLVQEIPVICHLYYGGRESGVADVYPGAMPELFWDIERGRYADELPEISRLVDHSPTLICVDVQR